MRFDEKFQDCWTWVMSICTTFLRALLFGNAMVPAADRTTDAERPPTVVV